MSDQSKTYTAGGTGNEEMLSSVFQEEKDAGSAEDSDGINGSDDEKNEFASSISALTQKGLFSDLLGIITNEVKIPEEEYEVLPALQQKFESSEFASPTEEFHTWLLSSWALKLRHHNDTYNKNLAVLILFKEKYSTMFKILPDINTRIDQVLLRPCSLEEGSGKLKFIRSDWIAKVGEEDKEEFDKLPYLLYELVEEKNEGRSSFLSITGQTAFLLEAQLCHLAKYLASFDPRVEPLLEIVFYWANINEIDFGICFNDNLPNPLPLTWLVLFFFCGNTSCLGRKLIPTPFEIFKRLHPPFYAFQDGVDLGFAPDPIFRDNWLQTKNRNKKRGAFNWDDKEFALDRDKYSLQMLILAEFFFRRVGRKFGRKKELIINSRGGQAFNLKYFLEDEKLRMFKKGNQRRYRGYSKREWLGFRRSLLDNKMSGDEDKEGTEQVTNPDRHPKTIFISPFSIESVFPIDSSVFPKMIETGKKLQEFLSNCETGKAFEDGNVKVDKEFVQELFKL